MRRLFEGGYYFPSLTVKCGINSRAATKRGTASIQVNMVFDTGPFFGMTTVIPRVKTGEQSNEFNTEMHDTKVHTQNSGSKTQFELVH